MFKLFDIFVKPLVLNGIMFRSCDMRVTASPLNLSATIHHHHQQQQQQPVKSRDILLAVTVTHCARLANYTTEVRLWRFKYSRILHGLISCFLLLFSRSFILHLISLIAHGIQWSSSFIL